LDFVIQSVSRDQFSLTYLVPKLHLGTPRRESDSFKPILSEVPLGGAQSKDLYYFLSRSRQNVGNPYAGTSVNTVRTAPNFGYK
jgi:hypothetical protein